MFKKLVNNVTNNVKNIKNATNKPENEKTPANAKSNQPAQPDPYELPERPFEIDFEQIWDYEFEELQEFIQEYEKYSTSIRNKYNDVIGEFRMTKEKLILLEQERKRLLIENEQYKTQNEQLKGFINQTTLQTQNSSDSPRSKNSSPKTKQTLQKIPSSNNVEQTDDELVTALKSRVLKLVDELTKAEEPICVNVIGLMANFQQSPQSNTDNKEDDNNQVMNTEDYANGGSEGNSEDHGRALDTDNNEAPDSERVPEDNNNKGSKNMEQALRGALKDSLGQALRRIGGEIRNISDAYVEALGQVKLKEKELAVSAQNEAKNEEYEQEIEELKGELGELKNELENKSKTLEKAKKAYEELSLKSQEERVHFRENLDQNQNEIQELKAVVDELKEEVQNAERAQEDLELERDELQQQLDELQKQLQQNEKAGAAKEKNEKDMGQERQRMQQSLQAIEEEKKKLEKKIQQVETERLDKENALIQEKLKHHQTIADLTKMKEKFQEVETHLNDEVEGRKVDIRKGDELKKRLVEFERKSKEYKKTIKKLSQQILDLHNKNRKEEEENVTSPPELTKGASEQEIQENVETEVVVTHHDNGPDRAEIINTQLHKIHHLEEKLEELHKEVQNLQANNGKLLTENKDLGQQVKVLTEKRELGLKEIKKLTLILDQARNGGSSPTLASSMTSISGASQREEKPAVKLQPVMSPGLAMGSPEDLKRLRKIKKGLDSVYIDIIMAITNEKLHENSENKPTGKLGELVKGPLPSEGFMKIEKKMNDSIVSLQEYIENFE